MSDKEKRKTNRQLNRDERKLNREIRRDNRIENKILKKFGDAYDMSNRNLMDERFENEANRIATIRKQLNR